MAAGTPIVASDIHGYKGVVRRDREALLVEPREPKQIAGAIARILRDDELRTEMSRAGVARAQEFSWERVTAKVDDFYGVVIRRLAARDALPASFTAAIPPSPRVVAGAVSPGGTAPDVVPATDSTNGAEPEPSTPAPAAR
jgi:hypothetical protein